MYPAMYPPSNNIKDHGVKLRINIYIYPNKLDKFQDSLVSELGV